MNGILKTLGWTTGIAFITAIVLGFMALTGTGFSIVNDGNRGIMKSGTEYDMTAIKPGYHFYWPIYQTMDVKTIRPILVNYSVTEGKKEDQELLMFEPALKGLDGKGIPISLALSIEVKPNAEKLPEMYREDGDFDNAFYKKVLQANREAVQSTISKFKVDTIMNKRADVEKTLTDLLKESYAKNPYFTLVGINLKDIIVPKKIRDKQEDVQAAKQDALKSAELIVKAQNEAKANAATAQGEADRNRIVAQGIADAITIEAKAQAQANKLLNESITTKLIDYRVKTGWVEQGAKVPLYVGSENSQFIMNMKK